jgi:hypothetical protein
MADLWNNQLVSPAFASDPPLKVNVPAKTYGLVLAILAVIGAVFALIGTIVAFTFSGAVSNLSDAAYQACLSERTIDPSLTCTAPGALGGGLAIAGLGELVALVALIVGAWGGFQMYQGNHRGRALMAYGLALAGVGQLIYLLLWSLGGGFGAGVLVVFIVWLAVYGALYYFTVISRFPDERPVVASPAVAYGPPPSYPPPPPS